MEALRRKEADLKRQLEAATRELAGAQARQRQHRAASSKVLTAYQERTKVFQGEDSKVLGAYQAAQRSVQASDRCREFVAELRDRAAPLLREEWESVEHALSVMRRQALSYLSLYCEASRENADLVGRRQKFCQDKVEAMRREQKEAMDLGMADLAADLGASICKLEKQHAQVVRQVKAPDFSADLVRRLYGVLHAAAAQGGEGGGAAATDQAQVEMAQLEQIRKYVGDMGVEL